MMAFVKKIWWTAGKRVFTFHAQNNINSSIIYINQNIVYKINVVYFWGYVIITLRFVFNKIQYWYLIITFYKFTKL